MANPGTIVIVGAGQAGGRAAEVLRAEGFAGRVVLIGAESYPPYERPPLSKQVLRGSATPESTFLRDAAGFAAAGIELILGDPVVAIERRARSVTLSSGAALAYDSLLLATGARPRVLPHRVPHEAPVHYLRDIGDCLAIRAWLRPGARLVVVGGGLIGLEVAATARGLGCEVCVLELAGRLLGRVATPRIADFFAALHRAHGVRMRTGVAIDAIEGRDGACRLRCSDGRAEDADAAVVGIGIVPNTELAAAAGLEVDNGIVVDAFGRSSDPHIFAAGDVTSHFNPRLGRRLRLESWQNAQNQASAVAKVLCGGAEPYAEIPWFWSDQYDVNFQMLGLPGPGDEEVMRGTRDGEKFSVFYLRDGGRLTGVAAINSAQDIAVGRRLMSAEVRVDSTRLSDQSVPLKKLLKPDA